MLLKKQKENLQFEKFLILILLEQRSLERYSMLNTENNGENTHCISKEKDKYVSPK